MVVSLFFRERDIDVESDLEVATWMMYLNRTAYNGLYRVNGQGRFNVPFGRYKNLPIVNRARIRRSPEGLRGVATAAATATVGH